MADTKSGLPEGTDTIIEGAGTGGTGGGTGRSGTASATNTTSTATNATGGRTGTTDSSDATDALITGSDSAGSERQGVRGMISTAGTKLRDEGKTRARGLVGQGLERGSSALSNISGIVDETVQQIEERLGPQYGDYARKTSQALNRYATTLAN